MICIRHKVQNISVQVNKKQTKTWKKYINMSWVIKGGEFCRSLKKIAPRRKMYKKKNNAKAKLRILSRWINANSTIKKYKFIASFYTTNPRTLSSKDKNWTGRCLSKKKRANKSKQVKWYQYKKQGSTNKRCLHK